MRALILNLVLTGTVMVSVPCSASAVNCEQVRRYLATGRSVDDVAETMIVDVSEVKKCQQAATDAKKGEPAEKPAAKGATEQKPRH